MRWWGKQRSVAAGGNIEVAVTGDGNSVHLSAPVRSAYREQVRRIAPPELVGREAELADLAAFCTTDSGPSYAWWRAEAWAGKTALMSWFALHPPQGVRVVPFFVTARLGAQNDITAYVDVVLEQLAELAGEGLPAHLTAATREAHVLHLYGLAAEACARRGERLVLLVDGLDEDRGFTRGPDVHSIASLLPARPPAGMRVLVAGRLNPPLPGDVPPGHPLYDPGIVRTLPRSPYAQVIRAEAERELKQLILGDGLELELLGLVAAAGGGLTAQDLAALTGAVPYQVADALRTRAGRTFGKRLEVYLLGHEELQVQAELMLGAAELARHRERLYGWAEEWRAAGWPADTPAYLLRGLFRMALAAGDVDRLLALAMDETRHDRMLVATGSDAAALGEIRETADRVAADEPADLSALLRLAVRRGGVSGRNGGVTPTLCRAWAELGRTDKAVALAHAIPGRRVHVGALAEVGRVLAADGDITRALDVLAEAEEALHRAPRHDRAFFASTACLLEALAEVGAPLRECGDRGGALPAGRVDSPAPDHDDRLRFSARACGDRLAEVVLAAVEDSAAQDGVLALVEFWARTGRVARAERLARSLGADRRTPALIRLAVALAETGDRAAADALFDDVRRDLLDGGPAPLHGGLTVTTGAWFAPLVTALLRTGDLTGAESVVTAALARWPDDMDLPALKVSVLTHQGRLERAQVWVRGVGVGLSRDFAEAELACALARAGRVEEARARVVGIPMDHPRADVAKAAAETLAAVGRYTEAERVVGGPAASRAATDALLRGALRHARSGAPKEAERFVARVEEAVRAYVPPSRQAWERVIVAGDLRRAGHHAAARSVLDGVEDLLPSAPIENLTDEEVYGYDSIASLVAEELAATGELDRAEALLHTTFEPLHCVQAWASVLRGLIEAGEYERADALIDLRAAERDEPEVADLLRGEAAVVLTEVGRIEQALALADLTEEPQSRVAAFAALAQAAAAAGQHDRSRALLGTAAESAALTREVPSAGHALMIGLLYRARRALGDERAALDTLAGAADLLRSRPFTAPDPLLWALVETGWYDHADRLVDELAGRGTDSLIEAYVAVGRHDRAARLAGLDGGPDRVVSPAAAVALAPVVEPSLGRALTVRLLLTEGSWTSALPAVVSLEPRTVPWIVETLRPAAGADTLTAARTSAPSERRSHPATPEAPPSPTP